ncbi:MAG TPA: FGGY family carbohydrate kinase, partial [Aggregatilineales bacterium]|nr:FGGY family carbohydrate kinase [Aggregatilineales bacterium]
MPDDYLIGSDIGSSSCKTLLANTNGQVIARASSDYTAHHPYPGWSEYDPRDWYQTFCQTVQTVLQTSKIAPDRIRAVCIVGITHDPVLLDQKQQILRPAIHFND